METFIITIVAHPGHEEQVAEHFRELGTLMKDAKGFHARKIYQARAGAMVTAVRELYTPEELAKHPEPPHEETGTQFIIMEQWETIMDRMKFSKEVIAGRQKNLIPHLDPGHTHEFYDEVPVD